MAHQDGGAGKGLDQGFEIAHVRRPGAKRARVCGGFRETVTPCIHRVEIDVRGQRFEEGRIRARIETGGVSKVYDYRVGGSRRPTEQRELPERLA